MFMTYMKRRYLERTNGPTHESGADVRERGVVTRQRALNLVLISMEMMIMDVGCTLHTIRRIDKSLQSLTQLIGLLYSASFLFSF